ncbi:MAG: helix-turn-helix domain-containing protein [Alloprevotella sp.]|nr:helix-turn-helix domain-containing protein [Alloprevotella sp.]
MCRWIWTVCLALTALCARAQEGSTTQWLARFEAAKAGTDARLQAANGFFKALRAEGVCDEVYVYGKGVSQDSLDSQVWYWAAEDAYARQVYDDAVRYALRALPLLKRGASRAVEGDCLNVLAISNLRLGKFDEAAKFSKECYRLDVASEDKGNIASSLNVLTAIYLAANQPQEAKQYLLEGINYARQMNNAAKLSLLYGNASEVYLRCQQPDSAKDFATRALELEVALGREDKVAVRRAQLGAVYIALGERQKALDVLQKAIPQLRKDGNIHSLGIACNQMGLLLHREGNDSAAVRYLNEALGIFTQQHDLYNELHTRKGLYEALRESDPAQAMQHNDRYLQLRDSIYDHETGMLLSKYSAEYGYEQLQSQNDRMRRDNRLILGLGLALILLLAGLYIYSRRRFYQQTRVLTRTIETLRAEQEARAQTPQTPPSEPATDSSEPPLHSEADRAFLAKVVNLVDERLTSGALSDDQLAACLHLSKSTFRRRIQALTGSTPKNFVAAIQMQRAVHLLTAPTPLSVGDISQQCGFKDASSFSRAFMRTFGVSPSRYAESHRSDPKPNL